MARSGRRPGSSDTRDRILVAARDAFGVAGFDGATIRGIAGSAGVDPALVHHYFGTKERLFVAATHLPVDMPALLPRVLDGPADRIGHRLAAVFLEIWDEPRARGSLLGILRSAVNDERAAAMTRALILSEALGPVVAALGAPDAAMRATLVGSQLAGLAMIRYVIGVEPLASLDAAVIVEAIGPTLSRYLTGPLGSAAGRSGD
ncbi:MAG TPA: TetR family transcriptional regulator [Candidatus Limnocylindrales bacterium]